MASLSPITVRTPDTPIADIWQACPGVGGRQVDGGVPSLYALSQIRKSEKVRQAQVDGKFTILLDSGVRTGSDIFKAIALGAQAVLCAFQIHDAVCLSLNLTIYRRAALHLRTCDSWPGGGRSCCQRCPCRIRHHTRFGGVQEPGGDPWQRRTDFGEVRLTWPTYAQPLRSWEAVSCIPVFGNHRSWIDLFECRDGDSNFKASDIIVNGTGIVCMYRYSEQCCWDIGKLQSKKVSDTVVINETDRGIKFSSRPPHGEGAEA